MAKKRERKTPSTFTPASTIAVPVLIKGARVDVKLERGRTYRVDSSSRAVDPDRGTIHPSTLKALSDESASE